MTKFAKIKGAAANGPEQEKRVEGHAQFSFDARCDAPLAHGLRPTSPKHMNALIAEARRMALSKGQWPASKGTPVVYLLRLRSGAIYTGASVDLEQRLHDHTFGQACRTTKLDPPTAVLWFETHETFPEARQREAQLKRWTRAKKEALVASHATKLRSLSKSHD